MHQFIILFPKRLDLEKGKHGNKKRTWNNSDLILNPAQKCWAVLFIFLIWKSVTIYISLFAWLHFLREEFCVQEFKYLLFMSLSISLLIRIWQCEAVTNILAPLSGVGLLPCLPGKLQISYRNILTTFNAISSIKGSICYPVLNNAVLWSFL